MGFTGMFKWLRKGKEADRQRQSLSPDNNKQLNNESCRMEAIRAFMERRKSANEADYLSLATSDKETNCKTFTKKNNQNKVKDDSQLVPGVPHIESSEFFEIGWVAGTENRYLEYIYAEWDNIKISVKRNTHSECENAIKADLEVLTEIRHPNIILLIATSKMEKYGLVSIFETLNYTIHHYIHEQKRRISIQEVVRCARKLAEALGFSHMRGIIHSAISSHCVFLVSGIIKLGGWELAVKKDQMKTVQNFETRLRAEVFRWLAPEIFCGYSPSEASDVYGLALLIWEMATSTLPWSGLTRPEVEKQYSQWEQGIMIDIYTFPPLFSKLLEAGLQIDIEKRTLSMTRMRRLLQRLELQYKDEMPIYVDLSNNNIFPDLKASNVPNNTSSIVERSSSPLSTNCKSPPKTLFSDSKNDGNRLSRSNSKREIVIENNVKEPSVEVKNPEFIELDTEHVVRPEDQVYNEVKTDDNAWSNLNSPALKKVDEEIASSSQKVHSQGSIFTNEERISSNFDRSCSLSSQNLDSSYEDDFGNPRDNIRKLKENLAHQRERFFYGDVSSQTSVHDTSIEDKKAILESVRSKNYEPHKPASHKTSFEHKFNNDSRFNTLMMKSTKEPNKFNNVYASFPPKIKESFLQSNLVNANYQNVFEASLWKREKMICLSKMSKDSLESDNRFNHDCTTSSFPQSTTMESSTSQQESHKRVDNRTFIIEGHSTDTKVNNNQTTELESIPTNYDNSGHCLIALREALDRLTDLIRPSISGKRNLLDSSLTKSLESSFEINPEDIKEKEAAFENIYVPKIDPDSEIESIERFPFECEDRQVSRNAQGSEKGNDVKNLNFSEQRTKCNEELKLGERSGIKNSNSYEQVKFSRRNSLPAALGQLKTSGKLSVGKLPILKGEQPDSTVEDLYIDDEFGDGLNVNMVLLAEDGPCKDEILPDLELSNHSTSKS